MNLKRQNIGTMAAALVWAGAWAACLAAAGPGSSAPGSNVDTLRDLKYHRDWRAAERLVRSAPHVTAHELNLALGALAAAGEVGLALALASDMEAGGVVLTSASFGAIARAAEVSGNATAALAAVRAARGRASCAVNRPTALTAARCLARAGAMDACLEVLGAYEGSSPEPWNAALGACARVDHVHALLQELRRRPRGICADDYSFSAAIGALTRARAGLGPAVRVLR